MGGNVFCQINAQFLTGYLYVDCSQQRSAGRPVTVLVFIRRRRASCRPPIILISIIPPSTIRIEGARLTINTGTTRWAPQWDRPIIITIIKRRVYNTCIIVSLLHVSSPNFSSSLYFVSFLRRKRRPHAINNIVNCGIVLKKDSLVSLLKGPVKSRYMPRCCVAKFHIEDKICIG